MVTNIVLEQLGSKVVNGYTETGETPEIPVPKTEDVSINETSIHDRIIVPDALALIPDDDAIIDGNLDRFFKTFLEKAQVRLAVSKNIQDVVDVFKQLDERIGKAEFVIAVMIGFIKSNELWKRYGYSSMNKFLDDLPSVCRVSRQTFTIAAQIGELIAFISRTGDCYNLNITPSSLHRNYSKVKFLYRMYFVWRIPPDAEVFANFRDMTYRDFEAFMKDYEVKHQDLISRWGEKKRKPSKKTAQANQPKPLKPQPDEIPDITREETEICQEIRLGHVISFLSSSNPASAESVVQFLKDARQRAYDRVWGGYRLPSEIYLGNQDVPVSEMDWADIVPESLYHTVVGLHHLLHDDLAPHDIKNAFVKSFRTRAELTLAQAYLMYRMENDPKLKESLLQYLAQYGIGVQSENPVMDFALNVLGVEESRYKWLKRMGNSLPYLVKLKGRVSFTSEGFLEKLSYLKTAIETHVNDLELVVDALNTVSAKRFRKFASNKYDDLSDPITLEDYRRAKPFIERLRSYQAEGKSMSIIGLLSKDEQGWIDNINQAMQVGYERMRDFYPGVIWDSNFKVESVTTVGSESNENKPGIVISAEEAFKEELLQNRYDDLLKSAA